MAPFTCDPTIGVLLPRRVASVAIVLLLAMTVAGLLGCHSSPFDPAVAYGIASVRIVPDSVAIAGEPSVFDSTGSVELSVAFADSAGTDMALDIVPGWSSSDESIATVSPWGTVVGVRPGVATISAIVGSKRGYAKVTVVPPADTGIMIAAHRGFMRLFPENTTVAIQGAFERGADAVELDVQLTVDEVPILMHDWTVDRTTNGFGRVEFMTVAQIKKLDACSKFGHGWAPCQVPTLREALQAGRGHGLLIIELKGTYTTRSLTTLLDLIRREGMYRSVVLTCFDYRVLETLRQLDASIPLGFLTTDIPSARDIIHLGRAASMPDERALFADQRASSALVRSASAGSVDIAAWTAASEADAKALIALGIRHIVSDVPLDKSTLR